MVMEISTATKTEVLGAIRNRYREASKRDKSRMLDEFVTLTSCHRKHAVRLLGHDEEGHDEEEVERAPSKGRRIYDEAVRQALIVVWEASDRICGKRLKAALPSMVTKRYSKPATPCDRLLDHNDVSEEIKRKLRKSRSELDPVSLLHSIRESQSVLAAVGSVESVGTSDGKSLESFLSQLPDLWKQGEVRPTHARRARGPRTWRTRPDPFEGVWCEVLGWLQQQPDATAVELMDRLILRYPERYSRDQLRTLQRRVRQWRGVMAKQLVYAAPKTARSMRCDQLTWDLWASIRSRQKSGNIFW